MLGACGGGQSTDDGGAVGDGVVSDDGLGSEDSGGSGGDRLDVSGASETGSATDGGITESCTKVDILFVIDNSGSMADEQQKLIANFPGFAAEMEATLDGVSGYHVGVVTSDDYWNIFASPGINADRPDCRVLGGLVTQSAAGPCGPFASGDPFMTEADDLGQRFACAANVGDMGFGLEKMAGAMTAALSPALNTAGQCNGGFIRPDALLVMVLITDEDDDVESVGSPGEWYDLVVAHKLNVPDNVVVLSLLWDNLDPACQLTSDEETGTTLRQFTELFTHGTVGSVCANSYQQFFSDSISVIDQACDSFVPPD
jgi:hypothetical protein